MRASRGASLAGLAAAGVCSVATSQVSTEQRPDTLKCSSDGPATTRCPADASGGVALIFSTGKGECLLGKTWGYDDDGVWVSQGCAGEFALGRPARTQGPVESTREPSKRQAWMNGESMIAEERPTWGVLD